MAVNGKVVYENMHFQVVVGDYPNEPLPCYLVINAEHGVVEYAHSVLYFAKAWADQFSKAMIQGADVVPDMDMLPTIGNG
jgi:hypothetical protein